MDCSSHHHYVVEDCLTGLTGSSTRCLGTIYIFPTDTDGPLLLAIVTPLQKDTRGVTIEEVIADRMKNEKHKFKELPRDKDAKQIAKSYVENPKSKLGLHQCRLRAQLFSGSNHEECVDDVWTSKLTDSSDPVKMTT